MDFSSALQGLKANHRLFRDGWQDQSYIELRDGIIVYRTDHQAAPWVAQQTDLLAEDWELA